MAITKSAKKEIRSDARKTVFNLRRTRNIKDVTKAIDKDLEAGKIDDAQAKLPAAYKAIDKAAKMKTLKKNTASRRKSVLAGKIKRAKATK